MAAAAILATGYGIAEKTGVVGTVTNFVGNLISGPSDLEKNWSGKPCPGSPPYDAVARALANAPADRLARLRQLHDQFNAGKPFPANDPAILTLRAMGGADCKFSQSGGKTFQSEFLAIVRDYGSMSAAPAQTSQAAIVSAAQAEAGLGSHIRQIGSSILDTAKNIVESTVSGAVVGARTATQGAAAGASFGTSVMQNAVPLVLIAGLGVALVLILRRR